MSQSKSFLDTEFCWKTSSSKSRRDCAKAPTRAPGRFSRRCSYASDKGMPKFADKRRRRKNTLFSLANKQNNPVNYREKHIKKQKYIINREVCMV